MINDWFDSYLPGKIVYCRPVSYYDHILSLHLPQDLLSKGLISNRCEGIYVIDEIYYPGPLLYDMTEYIICKDDAGNYALFSASEAKILHGF